MKINSVPKRRHINIQMPENYPEESIQQDYSYWGIFVNNQLDSNSFSYICLFHFSTCFEQPCAHHQEIQLYQYDPWYMSLYVGDRVVRR